MMTGVKPGTAEASGSRAGSPTSLGTGVSVMTTPAEPDESGALVIESKLAITHKPNRINVKGRVRIKLPDPELPVTDLRFDWDFDA